MEIKYFENSVSGFRLGMFATGSYCCKCTNCGVDFIGDKRAMHCLKCEIENFERIAEEHQRKELMSHSIGSLLGGLKVMAFDFIPEDTCIVSSKIIKGSANFNINQQPHGGQSVTQPAPNCEDATSPC